MIRFLDQYHTRLAFIISVSIMLQPAVTFAQVELTSPLSNALKACIANAVRANSVNLRKIRDQTDGRIEISLSCFGEPARNLFEALRPYTTIEEWTNIRNERMQMRAFGRKMSDTSECNRTISDSTGAPANRFDCALVLDLDDSIVSGM